MHGAGRANKTHRIDATIEHMEQRTYRTVISNGTHRAGWSREKT